MSSSFTLMSACSNFEVDRESAARLIRLKVEFDRSVYDTVIQAFREHSWIRLDGDIHPAGTGHELRNPRNVSLIPEAYG